MPANLPSLDAADLGQCPTEWQKSVYPKRHHPTLKVSTAPSHDPIPPRVSSSQTRKWRSARATRSSPTWHAISSAELGGSLDLSRVHFLGKIPYNAFIEVLQVSRARVYLTYPFVLSWSMPEAMSAGCLSFGSRTQPVQEVLHRGGNRLLVDFFSPDEIAERVVEALEDRRHLQRCEAAERSAAMPGRA
jgi:glycosyltransferase involved in cell wall biosynthesis